VSTPFDVAGAATLTDPLMAVGYNRSEIAAIMGDNALRLLRAVLPCEPRSLL
jgi:microsomal dipeptidase-like Zn-dependent dipeptidase